MRKQFLLLLILGLSQHTFSQTDSALFEAAFIIQSPEEVSEMIYNGREHVGYHSSIKGNPYYQSTDWQKGSLVLQAVSFSEVLLKYDLVADEVILRHPNGFSSVTLFTPRIQSFTLGNKVFVNLPGNGSGFKTGIYEQLAKGTITLYAKRSKRIDEAMVIDAKERTFIEVNAYYVLKEGKYYLIKKQKALLELMGDKRREVDAWIQTQGIGFKANPEVAFTQIVAYYNQLSQ